MTAASSLHAAGDQLLAVAGRSGPRHTVGCAALLELLTTGVAVDEALRQELCRLQISNSGFGVLVLLHGRPDEDPPGTGELAETLGVSAKVISETLARLELAGLLSRTRRPDNRRHNLVTLTEPGRRTIDRILRQLEDKIHRLTTPLSAAELENLRHACTHLRTQLS